MATHVHYDVEAFEKQCREMIAAQFKLGDEAVAAGDAEPDFIAAQKEFADARISFAVACLKAQNNGVPREVVMVAAGAALGMMHGSLMAGIGNPLLVAEVNGWIARASDDVRERQQTGEGTGIDIVTASPMEGGTA
jgi:hypothetical protein